MIVFVYLVMLIFVYYDYICLLFVICIVYLFLNVGEKKKLRRNKSELKRITYI